MFSIFARKTQPEAAPAFPAPQPEDYVFTAAQQDTLAELEVNEDGMVRLSNITQGVLGEQTQYISYHFDGIRVPVLTDGLRSNNDSPSYHSYLLHKEDVPEFIARLRAYRRERGQRSR